MRRYWIRFSITSPTGAITIGDTEVAREMPITCANDLREIILSLGQELMKAGRAVAGSDVSVLSWQRFEEPSILLPDRQSPAPSGRPQIQ